MTCHCGAPMEKQGSQYVCRRCGSWHDGITPPAHPLAQHGGTR